MVGVPQSSIHEGLLRALDWFVELANKHNVQFVLDAGCLLGAVRNQKFIPWDDDIDLTMSRTEFNRLINILADTDVPEEIEVFLPSSQVQNLVNPYSAKIRLLGVTGEEDNLKKRGLYLEGRAHSGPAIDIVALDFLPTGKFRAQLKLKLARILASAIRLMLYSNPDVPGVSQGFKFLIRTLRILPKQLPAKASLYLRGMQSREPSPLVCYSLGDNYPSVVFREEDYFPTSSVTFENRNLPSPNKTHNVLRSLYGPNYLTPPPENRRAKHFKSLEVVPGEKSFFPNSESS